MSAIISLIMILSSKLQMYLAGCILSLGNFAAGLILMESGNHSFHYIELWSSFYLQRQLPSILTYNLADRSGVILLQCLGRLGIETQIPC